MNGLAMKTLEFTLMVCTTMTIFSVWPGISWNLWLYARRKALLYKMKTLGRVKRESIVSCREDKLKKYWEIDLRKLR